MENDVKVYGVSVSYYTGKLESYLRYKKINYQLVSPYAEAKRIKPLVGAIQVPMVLRDDGRWMSDSTPIIQLLELEHHQSPVVPEDPVVRFIGLLIEDYADEWLWRAAMHYRWSYEHDRALLSRILTDEITQHVKLPRFWKLRIIRNRQLTSFVVKDGVTPNTQAHVESGYRAALANMTDMLKDRPFLLGDAPSIADFGMMGPMLRHFGQDPTPQEIMRNEGPAVYEWVARMWNANAGDSSPVFVSEIPSTAAPMLKEIAETHLVQLTHNATAYSQDQKHFAMTVQGCHYQNLPVSRYRVYCLERLREEFAGLSIEHQATVKTLLPHAEADILWRASISAKSNYDEERAAPFNKAINVYGEGVPQ